MNTEIISANSTSQAKGFLKKDAAFTAQIALIVASVLLIISLFFPVISLASQYRDDYEHNVCKYFFGGYNIDMDEYGYDDDDYDEIAKDYKDINIFEFAKSLRIEMGSDGDEEVYSVISNVVLVLYLALPVLIFAFALLKKGVPSIIFCVLDFIFTSVLTVICIALMYEANKSYVTGTAVFLHLIFNMISFAFAIWLTVKKSQIKKEKKQSDISTARINQYAPYNQQSYAVAGNITNPVNSNQ